MTNHLVTLGHRRIGLLEGPEAMTFARHRRIGHAAALRAGGYDVDPALVLHGPMTVADGRRRATILLDRPDPPTAIVCGNVMLAEGVLAEARSRGMAVPGDLSLLAHDDGLRRHRPDRLTPRSAAPHRRCDKRGRRWPRRWPTRSQAKGVGSAF